MLVPLSINPFFFSTNAYICSVKLTEGEKEESECLCHNRLLLLKLQQETEYQTKKKGINRHLWSPNSACSDGCANPTFKTKQVFNINNK